MSNTLKYKPEYCQQLIKWMAQGNGYITFGVTIDPPVGKSSMYEWESKYPEWKEAKAIGYSAGLKFFEQLLTAKSLGVLPEALKKQGSKGIDITAVIFALKTRFHKEYGEINQLAHSVDGNSGALQINFIEAKDGKPA